MIDKGKAIGKLQMLKGDCKGLVASVFDVCIQGIKEMPEDDIQIKRIEVLKELRNFDLCELCKHGAHNTGPACDDANYNCSQCALNCPCRKCNKGSEFILEGR